MSSIPSHSDIKEKQPGKTWTVLKEDNGAFNITLPLGFGKMSNPVVQSILLSKTLISIHFVNAQWESARPNLDLPKIEARSEVSA